MTQVKELTQSKEYKAWLQYDFINDLRLRNQYVNQCKRLVALGDHLLIRTAVKELSFALESMLGEAPVVEREVDEKAAIVLGTLTSFDLTEHYNDLIIDNLNDEGFIIQTNDNKIYIIGKTEKGTLHATFKFLSLIQTHQSLEDIRLVDSPKNQLRMLNHWDNMDGSIERGYAGLSIFFCNNEITQDDNRIRDYARMLASVGINGLTINNVNVHKVETKLITREFLPRVAEISEIFNEYGIQLFLSINYASPLSLGELDTADPLDPSVKQWWKDKVKEIYEYIPSFGGVVVKADSENRPGPFTYGRNHAEGANMLGEAFEPYGGIVFWRCFVYNCHQDWRDRKTDRARAAYDHFKPLDGEFLDNVILQIKNGPMDFQVREAVSPLFGAMPKTNQVLEFQVTQEYTGQQVHLCYLVPQWKEVLDFETYADGEGSPVKRIVDGSIFPYKYSGITAVSNIGLDRNWTGHTLAQANLYGYGRLIWNPDLTTEEVTTDFIEMTFGTDSTILKTINEMLTRSWAIYENYTSPLGVGWMVNPGYHYGPNVDGYEYSMWGTYHYADRDGLGVDRTVRTGTGYSSQYFSPNSDVYESLATCPDDLLLFFHHVPYTHELKSGKTIIQHIYDTHFEGVEQAFELKEKWQGLKEKIDDERFRSVLKRLEEQAEHSKEWRDIINTYFFRKSGFPDRLGRTIY